MHVTLAYKSASKTTLESITWESFSSGSAGPSQQSLFGNFIEFQSAPKEESTKPIDEDFIFVEALNTRINDNLKEINQALSFTDALMQSNGETGNNVSLL